MESRGRGKRRLSRVQSAPEVRLPLFRTIGTMDGRRNRFTTKNVMTQKLREKFDPFDQQARAQKLGWRTAAERFTTLHREAVLQRKGGGYGMDAELRALRESMTGVATNQILRPRSMRDEPPPTWVTELRKVTALDRDKAWQIFQRASKVMRESRAERIPAQYRTALQELLDSTQGVPGSGATVVYGIEGVLTQWRKDTYDDAPKPMPQKFKWTSIDLAKSASLEEQWLAKAPHAKAALPDTQFEAHRMRVSAALKHLPEPLNAVMDSAKRGDAQRLLALARQGADVLKGTAGAGFTPLHIAASEGHTEAIKVLVDLKARLDQRDSFGGFAALHWAVVGAKPSAVELLLKMKASLSVKTPVGDTPLSMARKAAAQQQALGRSAITTSMRDLFAGGGGTATSTDDKHTASEGPVATLAVLDAHLEAERLKLHRLRVKHNQMYGSQAAELLLQPKDPSGDVVGGVVGLAAAAIAEGEEADPDEEFAVDLTRPHSRAVLEAKLLDARIDGRMTPQEASERLGAFDRDLEAFQKGQLQASQDNADAAVKADVALREERRLARREMDRALDHMKQRKAMLRKIKHADLAVLHAVGDKTNKVVYTPLGAAKNDVPTVLSEQAAAIVQASRALAARDEIDARTTEALREERAAMKARVRSLELRNERAEAQLVLEEERRLQKSADEEDRQLARALHAARHGGVTTEEHGGASTIEVLNAALDAEALSRGGVACDDLEEAIVARRQDLARKQEDLAVQERIEKAAMEDLQKARELLAAQVATENKRQARMRKLAAARRKTTQLMKERKALEKQQKLKAIAESHQQREKDLANEVEHERKADRLRRLEAMRHELKARTPAEVVKRKEQERRQAALDEWNRAKGECAIAIQRTVRARAARMRALDIREKRWRAEEAEIMAEGEEERRSRFEAKQSEIRLLETALEPLQQAAQSAAKAAAACKGRLKLARAKLKANDTAAITEIARKKNRPALEHEVAILAADAKPLQAAASETRENYEIAYSQLAKLREEWELEVRMDDADRAALRRRCKQLESEWRSAYDRRRRRWIRKRRDRMDAILEAEARALRAGERRREADEAAAALDRAKAAEVERRRQARLQLLLEEKERQRRAAELQAAREAHERAVQKRRMAAVIRVQAIVRARRGRREFQLRRQYAHSKRETQKRRAAAVKMQSVVRLKLAARRRKEVAYLRAVENEAARLEKQRSQLFAGAATVAQSLALSIVGNVDQASNANRKDDDDVLLVGSAAASSSSGDSAEPSAVAVSTAAPQQSETGGLPEGWVEDWDPVSGFPYYVNTHTGESRWERPTLAHRVRAVARFAVGGR